MFLSLFSSNNIFDLLGSFSFWIFVAIAVILGFVIVTAIKYPRVGGPVLLVIFTLGILVFTGYCVIQLNYYYTSEGGIHGKLTGIFKTNEIEVVDDLSFEMTNIELTETTPGLYSASVSLDKAISLDTKQSLGVFVNGMPCDLASEVYEDFAIAKYGYTFYDNDKTAILTDTLTMNFAFYETSTYFELSTSGGSEAVKYWHYYFNKNGFKVSIAPFDSISSDSNFTTGDVSNFALIEFETPEQTYTEYFVKGSTITLPTLNSDNGLGFIGWAVNGVDLVDSTYKVERSVKLVAVYKEFDINGTFVNDEHVVVFENNELVSWVLNGKDKPWGTGYKDSLYYVFISGASLDTDYSLMFCLTGFDIKNDCWILKTGPSNVDISLYETYYLERVV